MRPEYEHYTSDTQLLLIETGYPIFIGLTCPDMPDEDWRASLHRSGEPGDCRQKRMANLHQPRRARQCLIKTGEPVFISRDEPGDA